MGNPKKGWVCKYLITRMDNQDYSGQKHESCLAKDMLLVLDLEHDQKSLLPALVFAKYCWDADYKLLARDVVAKIVSSPLWIIQSIVLVPIWADFIQMVQNYPYNELEV